MGHCASNFSRARFRFMASREIRLTSSSEANYVGDGSCPFGFVFRLLLSGAATRVFLSPGPVICLPPAFHSSGAACSGVCYS